MNIIQIANIFTDHCFVVYFSIHICNQHLQSKVNRLRILHTYKDTHCILYFHFTKVMFSKLVLCLHPNKIIYCFSMVWFSKSTYLLTSSIFYIFSRGRSLFSRRWKHLRIIYVLASLLQYIKTLFWDNFHRTKVN